MSQNCHVAGCPGRGRAGTGHQPCDAGIEVRGGAGDDPDRRSLVRWDTGPVRRAALELEGSERRTVLPLARLRTRWRYCADTPTRPAGRPTTSPSTWSSGAYSLTSCARTSTATTERWARPRPGARSWTFSAIPGHWCRMSLNGRIRAAIGRVGAAEGAAVEAPRRHPPAACRLTRWHLVVRSDCPETEVSGVRAKTAAYPGALRSSVGNGPDSGVQMPMHKAVSCENGRRPTGRSVVRPGPAQARGCRWFARRSALGRLSRLCQSGDPGRGEATDGDHRPGRHQLATVLAELLVTC